MAARGSARAMVRITGGESALNAIMLAFAVEPESTRSGSVSHDG